MTRIVREPKRIPKQALLKMADKQQGSKKLSAALYWLFAYVLNQFRGRRAEAVPELTEGGRLCEKKLL